MRRFSFNIPDDGKDLGSTFQRLVVGIVKAFQLDAFLVPRGLRGEYRKRQGASCRASRVNETQKQRGYSAALPSPPAELK
jgi:hypothetical protein